MKRLGTGLGKVSPEYNMAYIYRAQGCLDEAVTQLRRVVELDRVGQHPDLESDMALLAEAEAELAAIERGNDPEPS